MPLVQLKDPQLPNNSNRTVLVGRTGTGKTVGGLWHLSNYSMERPWIIFNFKGDEHIESLPNTTNINLDYVPKKKERGVFIVTPTPYQLEGSRLEESEVDQYLMKLWEREKVGIFADEAFMLGNSKAFVLCLTQGRSKEIPMIICTQRPVWITRFAFSEASYIQVFDLNDDRDIQTVESFVPIRWDEEKRLGPHQSWYYDIANDKVYRFNPVPDMDDLRAIFEQKLHRKWARL
jgi:hypothetical protein